jgi:hypothetical protein
LVPNRMTLSVSPQCGQEIVTVMLMPLL